MQLFSILNPLFRRSNISVSISSKEAQITSQSHPQRISRIKMTVYDPRIFELFRLIVNCQLTDDSSLNFSELVPIDAKFKNSFKQFFRAEFNERKEIWNYISLLLQDRTFSVNGPNFPSISKYELCGFVSVNMPVYFISKGGIHYDAESSPIMKFVGPEDPEFSSKKSVVLRPFSSLPDISDAINSGSYTPGYFCVEERPEERTASVQLEGKIAHVNEVVVECPERKFLEVKNLSTDVPLKIELSQRTIKDLFRCDNTGFASPIPDLLPHELTLIMDFLKIDNSSSTLEFPLSKNFYDFIIGQGKGSIKHFRGKEVWTELSVISRTLLMPTRKEAIFGNSLRGHSK